MSPEYDRIVGSVKSLMKEVGIPIPADITFPTSEANALTLLLEQPDVRMNRHPDGIGQHLSACLAVAHTAKHLRSDVVCERLLEELIHVRQALEPTAAASSSDAGCTRHPPSPSMSPTDVCVFMFRTVFEHAIALSHRMLAHLQDASSSSASSNDDTDDDGPALLAECRHREAQLRQLHVDTQAKVAAAIGIRDLVGCERTVRHALDQLVASPAGELLFTVDVASAWRDDVTLAARLGKLRTSIAGALAYFRSRERARTQIDQLRRLHGDFVKQLPDGQLVVGCRGEDGRFVVKRTSEASAASLDCSSTAAN